MKASRKAKSAFLTSLISLVLCFSMLLGTTYAWFTDTASTAVNKIQAGTLDVELQMKNSEGDWVNAEGKTLAWKKAAGHESESVLWEPGCTYKLPELKIVNKGSLALKYKIAITGIVGNAKLLEAIDFTVSGIGTNLTAATLNGFGSDLAAGATTGEITITGKMKTTAGNEYQGLSIDGIGITVYATQKDAEFDSFGNIYDQGAEFVKRHATIMDNENGETITLEAGKTYTVGNAQVVVADNGDITYTNNGEDAVAQIVTIETSGGTLTVNAPLDTIYHHGEANFVDITAIAGSSFHEFGKVDVLSVIKGRVIAEKGNNIAKLQVKGNAAIVAVPENQVLKTQLEKTEEVTTVRLDVIDSNGAVVEEQTFTTSDGNVGENVTIPAELKEVLSSTNTTIGEAGNYVAKIGDAFYETLQAALAAAEDGDTVVMLKDFENLDYAAAKGVTFSLENGVTLDGQGHVIRGNANLYMATAAGAESTVNNVVFENIHNDRVVSQDYCDYYGWENGKIGMQSAIYASGLQGTANITNCTFNGVDWDAIQATPKAGSTLNITGNTFKHTDTEFSQLRYIHVEAGSYYTKATINVNNNSFYKTKHQNDPEPTNMGIWYISSSYAHLTGNYFEYNPSEQMIETNSEVPGGTKSLFPARASATANTADLNPVLYVGSIAYLSSDTMPAAYYGSTSYSTLQEAINSTDRVHLAKDNSEDVTIPEGKTFTLYTQSFKKSGTITNNGTFVATGGTNVEGMGTIINNGTLQLGCNAATGYTVENHGTVKITSGTGYDLSKITNDENGQMFINGGTFTTQPQADWIAEWYTAAVNEGGTYTVRLMNDAEAIAAGAVARYSTATNSSRKYFKTLEEGIQNGPVHLFANATGSFTKAGSIDIYCDAYTFTGSLSCPGKTMYIDSGTAVLDRIECGTFYGGYNSYTANVTVKDGTATAIKVAKNATVVIEGGTYTGSITVTSGGTGLLTIKGGTFAVDPSEYVAAGYTATENNGTWTVAATIQ